MMMMMFEGVSDMFVTVTYQDHHKRLRLAQPAFPLCLLLGLNFSFGLPQAVVFLTSHTEFDDSEDQGLALERPRHGRRERDRERERERE